MRQSFLFRQLPLLDMSWLFWEPVPRKLLIMCAACSPWHRSNCVIMHILVGFNGLVTGWPDHTMTVGHEKMTWSDQRFDHDLQTGDMTALSILCHVMNKSSLLLIFYFNYFSFDLIHLWVEIFLVTLNFRVFITSWHQPTSLTPNSYF